MLEQRLALSATVSGIADWSSLGPSPTNQGQVRGMDAQFNPVTGAVNALAPHPTNPDIMYIGTVAGGVWRTLNARDNFPSWQPLTDRFPTLSLGDVSFDRSDASFNTLYAGIGRFSNLGGDGGTGSGLLKTTNGGTTWQLLASSGANSLIGENVIQVTASGSTVLAASRNAGLFRSTDGGQTFVNTASVPGSGLPNGACTGLVQDLGTAGRYYASVVAGGNGGVFVSNNSGQTWQATVNAGLSGLAGSGRLVLSLHRNLVNNTMALYVAIVGNNGRLSGVFRSGNGANWTVMDLPTTLEGTIAVGVNVGNQGLKNLAFGADPTNPNVVLVGGDRQPQSPGANGVYGSPNPDADDAWPNSIGSVDYTGRLFRGDASVSLGSQFTPVTDNFASGSAPHADSRDIAFDTQGNMIQCDDGGVYALINPNSAGRLWRSRIGNLAVTEFNSIAFNARINRTVGGAQDTGVHESTIGSVVPGSALWNDVLQADGQIVAVDTTNPTTSFHYYTTQNLGAFRWRSFDNAGAMTFDHPIGLAVVNTAGNLTLNSPAFDPPPFNTPYAVNAVDGSRMILGTTFLYESYDRGDNLFSLGGLNAALTQPVGAVGTVKALAYGAAGNANLLYVGTNTAGAFVRIRTAATGFPAVSVNYPGTIPKDIALDPATGDAYVLDTDEKVWQTTNAGASWVDLTGDLASAPGDKRTIAVYRNGAGRRILVGGQGGVFRADSVLSGALWQKFGRNLPHAPVNDLLYDVAGDVLVVGTLGRGAFILRQASTVMTSQRIVTFTGDSTAETFGFASHPNIPGYLSITRNGSEIFDLETSTFDKLVFNGAAGNDVFNCTYTPAGTPVTFIGGADTDTLNLGNGNLDTIASLVTFDGTSGTDSIVLNDVSPLGSFNYLITSSTVTRGPFFAGLSYVNTDDLTLQCNDGASTVTVAANVAPLLHVFGNNGNDNFIYGSGNLTGAFQQDFVGGAGTDQITFDDHHSTANRIWDFIPGEIINLGFTSSFESVGLLAGNGNDEITFRGSINQALNIDGGGGSDTFTLGFMNPVTFFNPVNLNGGSQGTIFNINDAQVYFFTTLLMDGGNGFNSLNVNIPNATNFTLGEGYFARDGGSTAPFSYTNINTKVFNGNPLDNTYTIYSAGSSFGTFAVNGNLGNDTFRLFPQPSGYTFQNLTINGNQGTDNYHYDASALTTNESYTVGTNFISRQLGGFGSETVTTASVNTITLTGGSGNDTFFVSAYASGIPVTINGGLGNDTCDLGSNDVAANITSLTGFLFNGQDDVDTFNLRNATPANSFTYTQASNTNLQASRTLPSAYSISLECFNTEQKVVWAGPAADAMNITSFASGELSFHAGAGDDSLNLPTSSDLIGRRVNFYGDGGTLNRITQTSNTKFTPTRLHIFQNTIGAFPGDTFFAPGGSIFFENVQTMALRMGTAADTAFITPDPIARINLSGDLPFLPGDTLNLALAGTNGRVFAGSGASGSMTSSNRATITYSGFEVGPVIDDVAPSVVLANINLNGIQGARMIGSRQSLDVQFSEDVSSSLTASSLQLTNTTTGQAIPTTNIAVVYDLPTNTAHFTFPGYANGILPDGDYQGKILAGLPDLFGNALPTDATFTFFFLNGDANHDRTVDFADLLTLAQNYGQSPRSFSQGDFNYDGTVDFSDLLILAQHYSSQLAVSSVPVERAGKNVTRRSQLFSDVGL